MMTHNKRHAIYVLCACAGGVAAVVAFAVTPFAIPCLFQLATRLPCPGCGLSRAFVLLLHLEFLAALSMNILLLPLLLLGGTYFVCALLEVTRGTPAIAWLNAKLSKKWIIALAAVLMVASWTFNIIQGGVHA